MASNAADELELPYRLPRDTPLWFTLDGQNLGNRKGALLFLKQSLR